MSHSLCVIGVYDEVKMTVPMIVRYVHSYGKKNVTGIKVDRMHTRWMNALSKCRGVY
jgi:hypothetical protein